MTTPSPSPSQRHPVLRVWRSGLTLSPATQNDALDVQRLHHLVLSGFRLRPDPEGPGRLPRVLFAAARTAPRPGRRSAGANVPQRLLVQCHERPDWQPLLDSGQLTAADTTFTVQSYADGDAIALRTIANPTYHDHGTRRTACADTSDCAAWLHRKLTAGGLDLPAHHISVGEPVRLTGRKNSHRITVISRELQARATVHDAQRLYTLLAEGIGHAKPYGCGLLLARPLR
ncbi:type I-E CRISPR-associated protein Cas6/Cse3/CasE [Streptomyces niveus]|uniref:type I-E CRISPR-associated protein Cas6/Cse3/CasE n=1 Tax=Streptomyces niveus TaxID=193462 RepID=UPI00365AAC62